ncbi:Transcription factor bHLH36 [Acorus gramineus]|uniref:Transcription factor bHLH36 n=1 Tax=Acorus gramineus TaxID=55184 RepID=A0AAV9AD50_ACOGR|nr:Transcription factor bHLH36 [Acorus gramineus]
MNYVGPALRFNNHVDELAFWSSIQGLQFEQQQQGNKETSPANPFHGEDGCFLVKEATKPMGDVIGNNENTNVKKKMIHRNVERQRRHEMATLYSSLRMLLPLEYLKGKRSISDHMNQAVHYIRHQQKKIQELTAKRDDLRRITFHGEIPRRLDPVSCSDVDQECSQEHPHCVILVRPSWVGVEVIIRSSVCCSIQRRLTLSTIVSALTEEGLNVVQCVSTASNGLRTHTIHSEVIDLTKGIDMEELQQKLKNLIRSLAND